MMPDTPDLDPALDREDGGTMSDHEPNPVPVPPSMPVTLCQTCGEKLRRSKAGWVHFGIDVPYIPDDTTP